MQMSEDNPIDNPLADFAQWDVENLRLTVFHTTDAPIPGLWELVVGISPESSDSRPREHVLQEQGSAGENRLLLVGQRRRLDWNLLPNTTAVATSREDGSPPTLTVTDQTISILRKALGVSLQRVQQVPRLALGVTLMQRAANLDEGMNQLAGCLPHLDLGGQAGGTDFVYQINRRRQSSYAPHVQINRLAKWQLEMYQSGTLLVSPAQGARWENAQPGHISKLVLDINTAAENNAISSNKMLGIFDELVELAREIAAKGDIP